MSDLKVGGTSVELKTFQLPDETIINNNLFCTGNGSKKIVTCFLNNLK